MEDHEAQDACIKTLARKLGAARAWVVAARADDVASRVTGLAPGVVVASPLTTTSPLRCVDLRALGKEARQGGGALVVDNTLATFAGCAAVRLGAHVSLEPLGEGLTLVGASKDVERALPGIGELVRDYAQADETTLSAIEKSLDTALTTWRVASDVALVVASYLVCHPNVASVRYPGLRHDASFEVAARTLEGGFGPYVDFLRTGESALWERLTLRADQDPRAVVLALEEGLSRGKWS